MKYFYFIKMYKIRWMKILKTNSQVFRFGFRWVLYPMLNRPVALKEAVSAMLESLVTVSVRKMFSRCRFFRS